MQSGLQQPQMACSTSTSARPSPWRFLWPSPPLWTRSSSRIGPVSSKNGMQLRRPLLRPSSRLGVCRNGFSGCYRHYHLMILSMPPSAPPLQNLRQNGNPWSTQSHMPDGARSSATAPYRSRGIGRYHYPCWIDQSCLGELNPEAAPPVDTSPPYFPSGMHARHGDDTSRYGGA